MLRRNINRPIHTTSCSYGEHEEHVNSHLSVSPSDMEKLLARGVPISAQMVDAANFDDGTLNPSWSPDICDMRGVDIADIWNAQQIAKENFKKQGLILKK